MTGRYARKTVPLQIRGIATEKYIGHPLPETIQEYDSDEIAEERSLSDLHITRNCLVDSFEERCSSTPVSADYEVHRAKQLTTDRPDTFRHRLAGSATERSSIYSFGDDEFERQSSLSVQKLFDELEMMLFEGVTKGPIHLQQECNVWTSNFRHLRVVGTGSIPQQNLGYMFYEHKDATDLTPRNSDDCELSHDLIARGKHVAIKLQPSDRISGLGDSVVSFPEGVEELIVQEGHVEEIFAIDTRPGECGIDHIQRDILQNLFSELWADVLNGLEDIINRHLLHRNKMPFFGSVYPTPSNADLFHDAHELASHDFYLTRESTGFSFVRPSLSDKMMRYPLSGDRKLEEVLKISSKTLLARDKNFNHDTFTDVMRPSSGFLPMSGRHYSALTNDSMTSARSRLGVGRGRLVPLPTNDHFKAFSVDDEKHLDLAHEVIRGYKLTPLADRLALVPSSLPASLSRPSGPLPPISRDANSSLINNNVFRKKALLRVRSAMPNKAPHIHDRTERVWASGDYSRPHRLINTPSSSDQHPPPLLFGMNRRSSTTLGFNGSTSHSADAGILGKTQRTLSILGNRIPEHEPDEEDDAVSEVTQVSNKLALANKRFLHSNVLRHSEGFGRRHPQHRMNTAIR